LLFIIKFQEARLLEHFETYSSDCKL